MSTTLNNCSCVSDCLGTITIPCCGGSTTTINNSGNGATVLFNDMTESSITSVGSEQPFFLAKEYVIPFGTLANDGDEVKIRAEYSAKISSGENYVTLKYDGVELIRHVIGSSDSDIDIEIEATISRKGTSLSADNLKYSAKSAAAFKNAAANQGYISWQGRIVGLMSKQYATPPGLKVEARAWLQNPVAASNYIKCTQFVVEYYPKA